MTVKEFEAISNIKQGITIAKRLLKSDTGVKVVQIIDNDRIYEASGFY